MSSLKIYNPLGEVDASVHFPLFGLEAQKGSWFAFGNYEIAIKPIQSMGITLQWADLPYSEGGFYDLYQAYKTPIDNTTFKIEWEKLTDQKWDKITGEVHLVFSIRKTSILPLGESSRSTARSFTTNRSKTLRSPRKKSNINIRKPSKASSGLDSQIRTADLGRRSTGCSLRIS